MRTVVYRILLMLFCLSTFCAGAEDKICADTTQSDAVWNKIWSSEILAAGTYYSVEIPFRIQDLDEDAFLYAVVVPDGKPEGTIASVRWKSEHLPLQQFAFYLPDDEVNCRIVLGIHKKGRAEFGPVTTRVLPPFDFAAVAYESVSNYEPYGMCTHFTRWSVWGPERGFTDVQVQESLRAMAAAGVQWIRVDAHWVIVEEKEGVYDEILLQRIDNTIRWAHELGIQVYLQLGSQPKWASVQPDAVDPWAYKTDRTDAFKAYVKYVTDRYKGNVQYWEVGNEVDWIFWKSSLADYALYLKTASEIIRAADPRNRVIFASFAFDGTHVWSPQAGAEEDALRRLYESGVKPWFDVLGAHYYPLKSYNGVYEAITAINQLVTVMQEFGDGDKPIWLTESGYSSGRSTDGSLEHQSEYLNLLYTQIITHPKVEKIFWYNWRCKSGEGDYEDNFGLVNNDFSERPAFSVLKNIKKTTLRPVNKTMLPSNSR